MEVATYERPREKLQKGGVAALTYAELLQVIIGSGNRGARVGKIARNVVKVLRVHGSSVTLTHLTAIQGLGVVKAGQVIAGLELAARLAYIADSQTEYTDILPDLCNDVHRSKEQILTYAVFDGADRLIYDHSYSIKRTDSPSSIVRKLFGEALAQTASNVRIIIGYESQSLGLTMYELGLACDAHRTASLLGIALRSLTLVSKSGEYVMKEESYGKSST